jgi:predicted 3-demethylubiquinone-9 3-methyltransferase (glyoxalase superfamily)
MQKITPFLWFDGKAEEAANFYVSIFSNARIVSSGAGVTFEIDGREFIAFNGGPMFKFTEAISLFVSCDTQQEINHLWDKLSEGGQKQRCGWLKDKYGVSWQIIRPHAAGQRSREIETRDAGNAADGQDRHRWAREGLRIARA